MSATILVVDDDAEMREVLRRVLASFGSVLEASNGKDGLRLVSDGKPDLMLLDVVMPGMDGLEVLKAARALAPGLPVVMLTGGSDLTTAKSALDDGASAYITKPFDSDALCAEVRRLIASAAASGEKRTPSGRPWRVRK